MVKYFSMFSGIGGFELGIQRAFDGKGAGRFGQEESISESDSTDTRSQSNERQYPSCVGYSEIDKYAIKVYERHFNGQDKNSGQRGQRTRSTERLRSDGNSPNSERESWQDNQSISKGHTNYGDATTINPKELPDFDLLVGGFPCQAFSVAGKRKGFDDTRGTLFFDIARILAEKRPRHLLLENVKGLLSHDKGKTFQTILGVLSDLGYRVEWQVLNSKDFGVPQNRERIFIIGHLRGECGRKVLPITGANTKDIGQFVDLTIGNNSKLTKQSRTLQARYFKGYSKRTAETSGVKENARIRRLTPKECERLQGFPDDWTEWGVEDKREYGHIVMKDRVEISDTQRYKMCGNAVTVNVIEAIIREFKCL